MLRIPDPGQAILLGLQVTHELMRGHGAPAARVGLHHGSAVERDASDAARQVGSSAAM